MHEFVFATNLNTSINRSINKKFIETNKLLDNLYTQIENNPPEHLCDPVEEKKKATSDENFLKDVSGKKLNISSVSMDRAYKLFEYLASQKEIPFGYPDEGCYARAHKMALLLDKEKIISGKVFLEGDLMVWSKENPRGPIHWGYHTAVIVNVKLDGQKEVPYVFDPSLFEQPVPVQVWQEIQTRHSAEKVELYFTKRFNYDLSNSKLDINNYTKENLNDMNMALKEDLQRQMFRRSFNDKGVM